MPDSQLTRRRRFAPAVVLACATTVAALALGTAVRADEVTAVDVPPAVAARLAQLAAGAGGAGDPAQLPNVEDATKGMQAIGADGGLFTLYRNDPADPTKDPTKLLALIPRAAIGKDLLMAVGISRGESRGFPAGTDLVRWELSGNQLRLVAPDLTRKQTPGKSITEAVAETYTPRTLAAVRILARDQKGGGGLLIDMGELVATGLGISPRVLGISGNVAPRYAKVKSFPDNVLVDVDLSGPEGSAGIGLSLRRLPEPGGYRPRVSDERVGYFTTVAEDWTAPYDQRENIVRLVNRWNLKKEDPSLEVSPPEKPIVFIIEKTVPLQWRRFVADGILEWNKAFEATAGISGALVVQQQTDDNEFKDVDPEDARYNFFRWIVTGQGFAMGPSRADPRTGEILDADIIFDDAMLRAQTEEVSIFGPRALAEQLGPEALEFIEKHPAFAPRGMTRAEVRAAADELRGFNARASGEELLFADPHAAASAPNAGGQIGAARRRGPLASTPAACTYAEGARHQLAVASLALQAASAELPAATQPTTAPAEAIDEDKLAATRPTPPKGPSNLDKLKARLPERLVGEMVKDVTMHEVGHTLGLRHNYKASTWLTVDEIKRRRDTTDEPTFASVMDYNATLFFPGDKIETLRHVTIPTVGPYDVWAIEYGYKSPGEGDGGEAKMLKAIAGRNNEPGLAYATDEDVMGPSSVDPNANRWDMGKDHVRWAEVRSELADGLLKDLAAWAQKPDEPNYFLRMTFTQIFFEKARNAQYVARLVGGQDFNRNRPGDSGAVPPLTPVPADEQRAALAFLGRTVFADEFLKIDPVLLNRLVPNRNWDGELTGAWPMVRVDFPVHAYLLRLQNLALLQVCNPMTLQRVYDAELKSAGGGGASPSTQPAEAAEPFTATELLAGLADQIWGAEFGKAFKAIAGPRRNLQAQHLDYLLAMAEDSPEGTGTTLLSPDLQNQVRYVLRTKSRQIGELLKANEGGGGGDVATLAHLSECKSKIDRTLEAPKITLPPGGGQIILLMGEDGRPVRAN